MCKPIICIKILFLLYPIFNITLNSISLSEPYPPMPKSSLAKKGRIAVAEENASYSDNDDPISPSKYKKSIPTQTEDANAVKHAPPEWERVCIK